MKTGEEADPTYEPPLKKKQTGKSATATLTNCAALQNITPPPVLQQPNLSIIMNAQPPDDSLSECDPILPIPEYDLPGAGAEIGNGTTSLEELQVIPPAMISSVLAGSHTGAASPVHTPTTYENFQAGLSTAPISASTTSSVTVTSAKPTGSATAKKPVTRSATKAKKTKKKVSLPCTVTDHSFVPGTDTS